MQPTYLLEREPSDFFQVKRHQRERRRKGDVEGAVGDQDPGQQPAGRHHRRYGGQVGAQVFQRELFRAGLAPPRGRPRHRYADHRRHGVEAARAALNRCNINPQEIGAIYIGSESHPYAVKPTGTIVGEAIGATPDLMVADYEFACKAGTDFSLIPNPLLIVSPSFPQTNAISSIFIRHRGILAP